MPAVTGIEADLQKHHHLHIGPFEHLWPALLGEGNI